MKILQNTLNPVLGQEYIWDYLLGLPLSGRWVGWDSYGEWRDDNTRSYYMTGKFGFRGAWHCGRTPDWKFTEVLHFAYEDCDIKEKWKRMVIWNRLYECNDEKLRLLQTIIISERGKHVITELLKLENRVASARSVFSPPKGKYKKTLKDQAVINLIFHGLIPLENYGGVSP